MAETLTVVTKRTDMATQPQLDSVTVIGMPPWKIVLVRSVRVYLMTLLGLLGAAGIGVTTYTAVTLHTAITMMQTAGTCALVAIGPALVSAGWNAVELLAKWDTTSPQLRA
jgi:hypothetical protein